MNEPLTKRLDTYLNRMNSMMDWQLGFAFVYYQSKAGYELNRLDIIEHPRHQYLRVKYESLIRRAKATGLI
jgi:hypothetical protein